MGISQIGGTARVIYALKGCDEWSHGSTTRNKRKEGRHFGAWWVPKWPRKFMICTPPLRSRVDRAWDFGAIKKGISPTRYLFFKTSFLILKNKFALRDIEWVPPNAACQYLKLSNVTYVASIGVWNKNVNMNLNIDLEVFWQLYKFNIQSNIVYGQRTV